MELFTSIKRSFSQVFAGPQAEESDTENSQCSNTTKSVSNATTGNSNPGFTLQPSALSASPNEIDVDGELMQLMVDFDDDADTQLSPGGPQVMAGTSTTTTLVGASSKSQVLLENDPNFLNVYPSGTQPEDDSRTGSRSVETLSQYITDEDGFVEQIIQLADSVEAQITQNKSVEAGSDLARASRASSTTSLKRASDHGEDPSERSSKRPRESGISNAFGRPTLTAHPPIPSSSRAQPSTSFSLRAPSTISKAPSTSNPADQNLGDWPFGYNVVADPAYLRDTDVPWGLKWEITRIASRDRLRDIDGLVAKLAGTNAEIGPQIRSIVRQHLDGRTGDTESRVRSLPARESAATSPWEELDREDQAWERGLDEGIGLKMENGWYGGKVQFYVSLDWDGRRDFKAQLEAPVIAQSTHFGRAFHSRSCITMRIRKNALRQPTLKDYLKRCHIFFGRKFYVLDAATEKVTLVDAQARRPGHDPTTERPGEERGINWMLNYLNPMERNQEQSVSKWRARFQLYFSDTVPGFRVHPARVLHQPDIELDKTSKKCPAEKVLTDGCGRISINALKEIQKNLKLDHPISAVQLRFNGSKGMALGMLPEPYEREELGDIILRPSQIKIKMDPRYATDEAKLTVDVVRPAKISCPARLSAETIQILWHNGVPTKVFIDLQKKSFQEDFADFLDWPPDAPLIKLTNAVSKSQNVVSARRLRLVRGMGRARGISSRSLEELEEEHDGADPESEQTSTPWFPDDVSGCPSSISETCIVNLQAGFRPESSMYLAGKLRNLLDETLTKCVEKFKIVVPLALTGTLVPDPLGVLEPDEISISLSDPIEINGSKVLVLDGPCLILRNPAKQETDVRKVKLVNSPRLHHLRDVIIVSVKNQDRSLASRLGGGDYDGDKAQIILEPALVGPFKNAATDKALEVPESVKQAFKSENGSVADLLVQGQGQGDFTNHRSDILLLPVNVHPGLYAIYHEIAVYLHGMDAPETIRLGYMFTEGLDGAKTGKTVDSETQRKDELKYQKFGRVGWNREIETDKKKEAQMNSDKKVATPPVRDKGLPPFIMDELRTMGVGLRGEHLKMFDARLKKDNRWSSSQKQEMIEWAKSCRLQLRTLQQGDVDKTRAAEHLRDLIEYTNVDNLWLGRDLSPSKHWMQAIERAVTWLIKKGHCGFASDLKYIYEKVASLAEEHYETQGRKNFTSQDIVKRQNLLRQLSTKFAEIISEEDLVTPMSSSEIGLLKASCAYSLSPKYVKVKDQFAFSVATRDLCYLKAGEGPNQTVKQEFIDGMNLHSGYVEDFDL